MRAYTRAEHDAIVAARGRPVTDDPMRVLGRTDTDSQQDGSPIDAFLANHRRQGDAA